MKKYFFMVFVSKLVNTLFFERIAHSLISSEPPVQIAHGRPFVLSDLSNEQMSDERIPSPEQYQLAELVVAHMIFFQSSIKGFNFSASLLFSLLVHGVYASYQ